MSAKLAGSIAVHLLTASGALCGLAALLAAARGEWQTAFAWLGAALLVDAVDGPLARAVEVTEQLPRFDGARLDHVIDFLNYCVVPAFMVHESGMLEGWRASAAAVLIILSSLFHFADQESKTADSYFVGFPAIWNIVCLYLFVFGLSGWQAFAAVLLFAALTFAPTKWLHPVRVRRLRMLTLAIVFIWSAAAAHVIYDGFPGSLVTQAIFAATAVYVVMLGLARTLAGGADRPR